MRGGSGGSSHRHLHTGQRDLTVGERLRELHDWRGWCLEDEVGHGAVQRRRVRLVIDQGALLRTQGEGEQGRAGKEDVARTLCRYDPMCLPSCIFVTRSTPMRVIRLQARHLSSLQQQDKRRR